MVSEFQKVPKKSKNEKEDSDWLRFKKRSNDDYNYVKFIVKKQNIHQNDESNFIYLQSRKFKKK